jgi:cyclopropane fatty-acyl-phospholipid synthase-like methyltransferase
MLYNQVEIDMLKNALEPGIRNPNRPRVHFERIMKRFFKHYDFQNKTILDIGPGHYDFCELARNRGATPFAIELDESVVKLGQHRKIEVLKGNLINPKVYESFTGKIDLLFCRGSINCKWFIDKNEHENYLRSMLSVLKDNGSAWISPCNEPTTSDHYKSCLETQMQFLKSANFHPVRMHKFSAYYYGIWSDNPKLIYIKNLEYHKFPW